MGLSRRAWTRLNRLRTGVGRFGANMLRWGLSTSDCCDCGAEQTADHITSGLCPIHRRPEGIHGLIELDVNTRTWLENCALGVWWHTREEEKYRTTNLKWRVLGYCETPNPMWKLYKENHYAQFSKENRFAQKNIKKIYLWKRESIPDTFERQPSCQATRLSYTTDV